MKKKFIDYYMEVAELTAKLSYTKRLQVGAVIVRENQIIATGYNGMPAGWENNCETKEWCSDGGWLSPVEIEEGWPYDGTYLDTEGNEMKGRYRLRTKPEVLHAESNAIAKVSKSTESSEGSTLFCTHAPCLECAKLIYQSGIKSVFFGKQYRDTAGVEFLKQGNVDVHQYNSSTQD